MGYAIGSTIGKNFRDELNNEGNSEYSKKKMGRLKN